MMVLLRLSVRKTRSSFRLIVYYASLPSIVWKGRLSLCNQSNIHPMNLKKWQFLGGVFAIALVIVWIVAKKQPVPTQEEVTQPRESVYTRMAQTPPTSAIPAPSREPAARPAQRQAAVSNKPARSPEALDQDGEEVDQVVVELNNIATTYDAAELPKIQPYLLHPKAEVREAAMNAMVTLGDASAGPLLRNAAAQVADPREAVEILDAADYVELPPSTNLKFKKKEK